MSSPGGVAIDVAGLVHDYDGKTGSLRVLDELSLSVGVGEHVAVTGSSGAGKTTLLSVLGGLESPQQGRIRVGDIDLSELRGDELAAYRRSTVGFVFQDFGLLGSLTALENVELAMMFAGEHAPSRRARALELLDAVRLAPRASHRPAALSGGEAQRVALARALANEPRLVLADEPTGNLDEESTDHVLELLGALPRDRGCTLVVVTHNRAVAARAERRLALEAGRLREVTS